MGNHSRRPAGWRALRVAVIVLALALTPLFFADMFLTVSDLVRPAFGWWAWTVPAATEGSFAVLYLLDLLLEWAGKPMGWLRVAPYPFAAASLTLNVLASAGSTAGMIGHAVVTGAFFAPVLACEAAVRSLSRTADDVARKAEMGHALRHARDLARARRGPLWRLRIPSLLRVQITKARPPASVTAAVAQAARDGSGASAWEQPVAAWVIAGLTQADRLKAGVETERRQIRATTQDDKPAPEPVSPPRQKRPAAPAPRQPAGDVQARVLRAWEALGATATNRQLADHAGVSPRTVQRYKPQERMLRAVEANGG